MENKIKAEEIISAIDKIMLEEITHDKLCHRLETVLGELENKQYIITEMTITSHRGQLGKIIVLGKKILRKLLRWYTDPIVAQQNEYNDMLKKIVITQNKLLINNQMQYEELKEQLDKLMYEVKE